MGLLIVRKKIFCLFIYGAGMDTSAQLLRPFIGVSWMIDVDECRTINGMNEWQGKPQYKEETCPSADCTETNAVALNSQANYID
jgi:hypothetical protein